MDKKEVKCQLPVEGKKRCCCTCALQHETTACNCFNEWPESLFLNHSEHNEKHGSIGWACFAFLVGDNGPIDIQRSRHGICEMWQAKKETTPRAEGEGKAMEALLKYQQNNRLRNDLDAYLFAYGEWAYGDLDERPDPKDYDIT